MKGGLATIRANSKKTNYFFNLVGDWLPTSLFVALIGKMNILLTRCAMAESLPGTDERA